MTNSFLVQNADSLVVACIGIQTAINSVVTIHFKQPWFYTALLLGIGALTVLLEVVFVNRVLMMNLITAQTLIMARMFVIHKRQQPATLRALFRWLT